MTDDAGRQVVSGEVNVPQGCREIQPCLSPIEIFPTQGADRKIRLSRKRLYAVASFCLNL